MTDTVTATTAADPDVVIDLTECGATCDRLTGETVRCTQLLAEHDPRLCWGRAREVWRFTWQTGPRHTPAPRLPLPRPRSEYTGPDRRRTRA